MHRIMWHSVENNYQGPKIEDDFIYAPGLRTVEILPYPRDNENLAKVRGF